MAVVDIEILSSVPFLEGATVDVLEQLAAGVVEKTFRANEVILEEGSTGREIYLLVDGQVEIVKGRGAEKQVLARRGPGQVFGEMGLIEAKPRFASVRALEPVRVLEFTKDNMREAWTEQPQLLFQAVQVLSARLRESDRQMIAGLQRKNRELERAYRELQEAQAALVEKERFERELELARDLQQSILPHEFPPLPGFSCAAQSRPARQVGGDFYDVIPLAKDRVGLVMADVSDKGMAAALFMGLTHSLVHAEATRSPSPRQVLLNVHRLLLEMSQADMFVTVFYGVLDLAQSTLCYVRAGHDRPLLYSPSTGECRLLTAKGSLLGMIEEVDLEEVCLDLDPGDLLVLYTDGITDAKSPAGEFLGVERLREVVCSAEEMDVQELCDLVFERADRFQAGTVQFDDMALLVVRSDVRE